MAGLIAPVARLIEEFSKLPGIGTQTAQRLTYHVLRASTDDARALAAALIGIKENVAYCSVCCNITEAGVDPCDLCADPRRESQRICVVEEPLDVLAIERTGEFRGRYHVLHGALSPLDGVGPGDIKIRELLVRLEREPADEIVLATNPDVEGEATALYLTKLLKPLGFKVTRIAQGVPMGGDLEYADQVTLARALAGRREM